jgi:hypothetical protein
MRVCGTIAIWLVAAALPIASGCGSDPTGDGGEVDGGDDDGECMGDDTCDLPTDPTERSCALRRADAFNPNQYGFTETALRWSCADVDGVTGVDRGQEYCEYFAIVRLPGETAPGTVLGRVIRHDPPEGSQEYATYDTTPVALSLDDASITALEADPAEIVGQCVFTSWNEDEAEPPCVAAGNCPRLFDVPVNTDDFRMKYLNNSTEAAQFLVEDCMCALHQFESGSCVAPDPLTGDPDDPKDRLHDDFTRGCMLNATINATEYRKSDTTVCTAMLRLAECGCSVAGESDVDFPQVISPTGRRGFPLGTWSEPAGLPPGCRYIAAGDQSQTLVSCDLSAGEVLSRSADLKQLCREKYGPNVVVHVPITPAAITCDPSASASPYTAACTATPWVVEAP